MTEAELAERNAIITDLYLRHLGLVRWLITTRHGHDPRLSVDDIVHTAFERATARWRDLINSDDGQRRAWLCKVATNYALDLTRALSYRMSVSYDPIAHEKINPRLEERPEDAALYNERVAALGVVMARLPAVDRETLIICAPTSKADCVGVSQHFGIARQAAKSRAMRARDRAQRYCADVDLTA